MLNYLLIKKYPQKTMLRLKIDIKMIFFPCLFIRTIEACSKNKESVCNDAVAWKSTRLH